MNGEEILKGIIAKGGVIGAAAKMYLNDPEKTDGFIRECYKQCHNPSARRMWGEELVSEIEKYSFNSISYSEKSRELEFTSEYQKMES